MKLSKILLRSAFATALLAGTAAAEPKTPDEFYKEGDTQYNLGNFDKAVDAFKQGFALETNDSKKPAYLYNIAQSYRQAQNCQQALFFYKRFLALKATDTVKPLKPQLKADVEARIAELEDCLKQQDAIRNKPPNDNIRPDGDGTKPTKPDVVKPTKPDVVKPDIRPDIKPDIKPPGGDGDRGHGTTTTGSTDGGEGEGDGGEGDGGEDDGAGDDGIHAGVTAVAPHLVSVRLLAGASKIGAGTRDDLAVPVRASGTLLAGYPLALGPQLTLDLGAGLTYTPISYDSGDGSKSASLIGVGVNVGATYEVAPKIGLRGDLGLGELLFAGLAMGNPFTDGGAATTGALGMLNVRVGVSAEYAVTPNVVVVLAPASFAYSPAKTGLRTDITSLTRLDFMVGVGYRM